MNWVRDKILTLSLFFTDWGPITRDRLIARPGAKDRRLGRWGVGLLHPFARLSS
jgi:hypothetical protein